MSAMILDVREKDEFAAEHIEHSVNVPLSCFASLAPGFLNQLQERDLVIMCRSGKRAQLAALEVQKLGYGDKVNATVFEGGILEWRRQGHATVALNKKHFPIMRQVQLVAGAAVLLGTGLGFWVNPSFFAISAFFGAGLMLAGATGFCGMAFFLARLPWNRSQSAGQCSHES